MEQEKLEGLSRYELAKKATELLRENGCNWEGREYESEAYRQRKFEEKMSTGACSRLRKN